LQPNKRLTRLQKSQEEEFHLQTRNTKRRSERVVKKRWEVTKERTNTCKKAAKTNKSAAQMRREETNKRTTTCEKAAKTNRSTAQKMLPTKAQGTSRCESKENSSRQGALEDAAVALSSLKTGQVFFDNKKQDTERKDKKKQETERKNVLARAERDGECITKTRKKVNFDLKLNINSVFF
jgi:hypothetical protein